MQQAYVPPNSAIDGSASLGILDILRFAGNGLIFLIIATAPVVPYIQQYSIIRQKRDIGAFSIYVCAILLYGQAFRILFW